MVVVVLVVVVVVVVVMVAVVVLVVVVVVVKQSVAPIKSIPSVPLSNTPHRGRHTHFTLKSSRGIQTVLWSPYLPFSVTSKCPFVLKERT